MSCYAIIVLGYYLCLAYITCRSRGWILLCGCFSNGITFLELSMDIMTLLGCEFYSGRTPLKAPVANTKHTTVINKTAWAEIVTKIIQVILKRLFTLQLV